MCGISGVIYKEQGNFSELMTMQQHLTHRGPDAYGVWIGALIEGNVGLAHNRLSIVDLSSNGNQPMQTDRYCLVYNGEIYNYQELKTKISPRQWKSHGDTETLLFYIEEYGLDQALRDIEGMFAFALYDKFEQILYMVTDPMGIKPLYYCLQDDKLLFASSYGAIALTKDKWTFDTDALYDYLALGATRQPFFTGIRKAEPGVIHTYKDGKMEYRRYYYPTRHQITEEELMEEVKASIKSVKLADVPVFIFLSGGIDSSVVASQSQHVNAVHLASPEIEYARQVANKYGNRLIEVDPMEYSAEKCLEDYSFKSGDASMAALIPYITSAEVKKYGKVGISANGADELFFGYDRMGETQSKIQYQHIFRSFGSYKIRPFWEMFRFENQDSRMLELTTYLCYDLNKTLDFASMCHSLEVRVPFLNQKVVEKALSITRKQHVNGYGNKSILKKFLVSEGFNQAFIQRPKVGFSMHYEPKDYEGLKVKGKELLKQQFNIAPVFNGLYSGRDERYYAASAASFYCWWNVWKDRINL